MALWNQSKRIHVHVFSTFEPINSSCRSRPINYKTKKKLMVVFFIHKNSVILRRRSCIPSFISVEIKVLCVLMGCKFVVGSVKVIFFSLRARQINLNITKVSQLHHNYHLLKSKLISPVLLMYQKSYISCQIKLENLFQHLLSCRDCGIVTSALYFWHASGRETDECSTSFFVT